MGKAIKAGLFAVVIIILTLPLSAPAQSKTGAGAETDQAGLSRILDQLDKQSPDKTLSPFFFVDQGDPGLDMLPLKSTRAQVNISGVMAQVTITQVYKNEGQKALEAVYVFPASAQAAVHALRMTIGERIIEARIMERKKARETYKQAKEEGRTASLLEQQRPNVFQMNVANILPGDEIRVELKYNELIVPEQGTYRFIYPAVVGPRYSNAPAGGKGDKQNWVENPYLHEGKGTPYEFGLTVDLRSGPPLALLTSPSHEIEVEFSGKTQALVKLKKDDKAGTKDFVLEYRLAGKRIETGLLLYPGETENHFLLMVEPPKRITPKEILPREYVFVVDVSGSMRGFPLDVSQDLMTRIIEGLGPDEFMNVLLFAGGSSVLSTEGSLPASEENKAKARAFIQSAKGGGGTELLPALKRALDLPGKKGLSRIVVVITDGYVHVEPEAIDLVKSNLGRANLFTFGIGSSVNRYLIEVLARVGQGEPQVVLNRGQAKDKADRFRRYIESPVLTDIKVDFQGFQVSDMEPSTLPDLFGERPVILYGKYKGDPKGLITLKGETAEGGFVKKIKVSPEAASPGNAALKYLWARSRITALSDLNNLRQNDRRIKEVTDLGLKYGLLTAYTSFVAVDKIKRADGEMVTVRQPLPLPLGVSDSAVGGNRMMLKARGVAPLPSPPAGVAAAEVSVKPKSTQEEQNKPRLPYVRFSIKEARAWPDQEKLLAALVEKQDQFDRCYRQSRMHFRDLKGRMELIFKVDSKGAAQEIKILTTPVQDMGLFKCLTKILESIAFPVPASGTGELRLILDLVD